MPESPARQQNRARSLRARGLSQRAIAVRLGVSRTTVARWLNPAYAERQRDGSREAKLSRRRPCERCMLPISYDRPGGVCRRCRHADAAERHREIAVLYRSGRESGEIARRLGLHPRYVTSLVGRLARSGNLEPRFAYRDARTVRRRDGHIAVLRRRRLPRREIANAVGLTPGSLSTALLRLRE